MKRLFIACAAGVAFLGSAHAADLPSTKYAPAAPMAYAPMFTWTGFYVGGNVGYHWSGGNGNGIAYYSGTPGTQANLADAVALGYLPSRLGNGQDGFTGGVQGGYNYQMGSFVIGVEGDVNWVGGSGKSVGWYVTQNMTAGDWAGTGSGSVSQTWFGTLRARAGFAIDHFLFYGTGGLAFGNGKSSLGIAATDYRPDTPVNYAWYGSKSDTSVGWTLGAGVEYAITNNWTVKVEYLYYSLGEQSYTVASPQNTDVYAAVKFEQTGNILRTGVNYKF
jgi:outer membrane immunogenic protein